MLILFNPAVANAFVDATEYSTEILTNMLDRASMSWLTMRGSVFKAAEEASDGSISSNESGN